MKSEICLHNYAHTEKINQCKSQSHFPIEQVPTPDAVNDACLLREKNIDELIYKNFSRVAVLYIFRCDHVVQPAFRFREQWW